MKRYFLFFLLLSTLLLSAQTKTVVYFNTGESTLLPPSVRKLDSLIIQIKKSSRYRITINGYCDSTGTHTGNILLGKHRAERIFDYFYSHGIDGDSMIRNGFAEASPAAAGHNRVSYAKNRRAEILVSSVFNPAMVPSETHPFDASMSIEDLRVGQLLVLKNLNFVNNEATLPTESVPVIKALLKIMQENPTLEIKLNGHVCCTADKELSVARAKFVYDYLASNGIDEVRMTYEGFSNRQPLLPNDEIDAYAAKVNRRVEITIVKK
jgi:outer membrane protein OmpA-like peptidoglycan-associated protein